MMVIFLIIVSTPEQLNEKWLINMMRPVKKVRPIQNCEKINNNYN